MFDSDNIKLIGYIKRLEGMIHSHWNRMTEMFTTGVVQVAANDSGAAQMLQVQIPGGMLLPAVPSSMTHGFSSSPPIGTTAIIFNQNGHCGQAVILATHHPASRPKGLSPGECIVYDASGQTIYLQNGTKITINAKNEIDIVATTTVNITAPSVNINASTLTTITSPVVNVVGVLKVNDVVVEVP